MITLIGLATGVSVAADQVLTNPAKPATMWKGVFPWNMSSSAGRTLGSLRCAALGCAALALRVLETTLHVVVPEAYGDGTTLLHHTIAAKLGVPEAMSIILASRSSPSETSLSRSLHYYASPTSAVYAFALQSYTHCCKDIIIYASKRLVAFVPPLVAAPRSYERPRRLVIGHISRWPRSIVTMKSRV